MLSLYSAELLPTHLRASASAGVWGLGRVVSALVPIALLPLLGGYTALAGRVLVFGLAAMGLNKGDSP